MVRKTRERFDEATEPDMRNLFVTLSEKDPRRYAAIQQPVQELNATHNILWRLDRKQHDLLVAFSNIQTAS